MNTPVLKWGLRGGGGVSKLYRHVFVTKQNIGLFGFIQFMSDTPAFSC